MEEIKALEEAVRADERSRRELVTQLAELGEIKKLLEHIERIVHATYLTTRDLFDLRCAEMKHDRTEANRLSKEIERRAFERDRASLSISAGRDMDLDVGGDVRGEGKE